MIETLSIIGICFFTIIFLASIWANVFLLRKLLYFNENFQQINDRIEQYRRHVEALHEMPMFYGDENLQKLIEHSRDVRQDLYRFSK
jgi:hypothetical protein